MKNLQRTWILFLLTFLAYSAQLHANPTSAAVVLVGSSQSFPRANSIWVENGDIVRAQESGRSVIIKGIKPGFSEVRLDSQSIAVSVLNLEQERTLAKLKKIMPQTLGLSIYVEHGRIIVGGRLFRMKDWLMMYETCFQQNCQYEMKAKISDSLWRLAEQSISQKLTDRSLSPQRLERSEPPVLHLSEKSTSALSLEKALSAFGISVIKDSNSIELAPMVKVQITVAEVKRDHLLQYGLKWPSSYSAQIFPTPAGVTDPQFLTAEFWEHSGAGRILASPNLLCRSGKDAEFLAGGEFPIKVVNFRLEDVIWKKYGILLKVSPVADFTGRMSISITTEVSSIDPSRTVDGIPGLFTNRVQSFFDLARPRTIALSGLIKSEDSKAVDGLPTLSQIPILGSLFGSKEFRENRTELVIFVRPEVISPDAPEEIIQQPTWEQAGL